MFFFDADSNCIFMLYSTGWFYLHRQFPGHEFVELNSGAGAGVFLGEDDVKLVPSARVGYL